jgi:hypothetical protein
VRGKIEQPVGIIAARVRNRQHDRKPPARGVKDRRRKRVHGQLSQIRTGTEMLQRIGPSFASGKSQFFSAL